MPELRMRFSRTGAARYLSHLDVFRTLARAFTRAGVPLAYSQGFNPHPYISIAHPLSVGAEGLNELLEFSVTHTNFDPSPDALNAALPDGLRALDIYSPNASMKSIQFAEYLLELEYDAAVPPPDALESFFAADEIIITKKTKSGIKPVNLRTSYTKFSAESADGKLICRVILHAKDSPINPKYFLQALERSPLKPDFARFTRLRFMDKNGANFA